VILIIFIKALIFCLQEESASAGAGVAGLIFVWIQSYFDALSAESSATVCALDYMGISNIWVIAIRMVSFTQNWFERYSLIVGYIQFDSGSGSATLQRTSITPSTLKCFFLRDFRKF
jgi:hypothetical protein